MPEYIKVFANADTNISWVKIFLEVFFMKKRISILTTAALCVTIGSVYATWTYAQDTANSLEDVEISKTLETAETIAKGDIQLESNTLELIVDKADDSYQAVLTIEGELIVKYVPHELATEDNIKLQFEITGSGLEYNGEAIFVLPATATALGENNTWTINSSNLGIEMGNITLGTYAEYEAFKTAFNTATLTITFSEVTA